MFEELKKRLEAQYSDKWFVEHGATDDGLSRVDDGTSSMEGLFPFYGEVGDMELVVMMRNELPAMIDRLEKLEEFAKLAQLLDEHTLFSIRHSRHNPGTHQEDKDADTELWHRYLTAKHQL